jgi:hypothetical protein
MLKELIRLANALDSKGLVKEADFMDNIVEMYNKGKEMFVEGEEEEDVVPEHPMAPGGREAAEKLMTLEHPNPDVVVTFARPDSNYLCRYTNAKTGLDTVMPCVGPEHYGPAKDDYAGRKRKLKEKYDEGCKPQLTQMQSRGRIPITMRATEMCEEAREEYERALSELDAEFGR